MYNIIIYISLDICYMVSKTESFLSVTTIQSLCILCPLSIKLKATTIPCGRVCWIGLITRDKAMGWWSEYFQSRLLVTKEYGKTRSKIKLPTKRSKYTKIRWTPINHHSSPIVKTSIWWKENTPRWTVISFFHKTQRRSWTYLKHNFPE